jgi:hypothetical protein
MLRGHHEPSIAFPLKNLLLDQLLKGRTNGNPAHAGLLGQIPFARESLQSVIPMLNPLTDQLHRHLNFIHNLSRNWFGLHDAMPHMVWQDRMKKQFEF